MRNFNKSISIGLSLPYYILDIIDKKRADISRSRYILRLIEKDFETSEKLIPVDNSFDAKDQQVSRS